MMRLRLPRRLKARLWKLRDLIRPPRAAAVPEDEDPLYQMLSATPAWSRREVLRHAAARQRLAQAPHRRHPSG
ncbi:hypothetical protein [Thiohalocapsa sp.]|jgi:hypothetical protein|uniref:hypothetical protein n=1 Tax=Thiohalocapsa sp. TaxID=2497641 RepID=UPI0025E0B63C|nr:hypothetical protein [Thiohalocapsa sp.]